MRQLLMLCILSSLILLSSCNGKKNQNNDEVVDIVGFWEGTYTTVGRPDLEPQYINFLIKEDGTVTNESVFMSEIRINLGTWELNSNVFKIQLSNVYGGEIPNPQTGTAEFDPTGFLKKGVIKNLSGSGIAEFEMVRRN